MGANVDVTTQGAKISKVRRTGTARLELLTNAAMLRYASGDDRAFDELYKLLAPRLLKTCLRLTDRANAEDICQETFVKIHLTRNHYSERGNVSAWAFTIARHTFLDRVRYRQRRPEYAVGETPLVTHPAPGAFCPEFNADERRYRRQFASEVQNLSENLRSAHELVSVRGLSYSEAGAILDASQTAVKQRHHRATQQLTAAMMQWAS